MSARWRCTLGFAGLTACLLPGCVERRFVITTDPPGAIVLDEKQMSIGPAPADHPWIYNGTYEFRLIKDGFETKVAREKVAPTWYEYFPLDFISENVVPWTIRDIRRFHYQLQPLPVIPPENVWEQGKVLRQRGQSIGVPLPAAPAPPLDSLPPPTPPVAGLP